MIVNDWDAGDVTASDRAERTLLGALLVAPYLLGHARILEPHDFRNNSRGQVFSVLRNMGHVDSVLLALEMERQRLRPPDGMTGWQDAIGRLLGEAFVDDELAPEYARSSRRPLLGAGPQPWRQGWP